MGYAKWIAGGLGFITFGPLGALAGYALGSLVDGFSGGTNTMWGTSSSQESYKTDSMGQRNSFLFSMLVMASYIIKADNRIMHSEMEFVRQFLRVNFGENAINQGEQILLNLFEQRKQMDANNPEAFKNTIKECGLQIQQYMSYSERLQMLDFLAKLSKADGSVAPEEIAALREVAIAIGLTSADVDSVLSMGSTSLEDAYKVLGVTAESTDEDIRKAYRKLALEHHPDKVETLGEDIKKAAEQKFKEINEAKEIVYKARGMK